MSYHNREERYAEEQQYSTTYDRNQGYGAGYGGPREEERNYSSNAPPPPQVSHPWRAHWDDGQGRYIFINEQTDERTSQYPGSGYGGHQGGYSSGYGDEQRGYRGEEKKSGGHGLLYGAIGAAAGLAGGAFLAHEAGNIGDAFEEGKDKLEDFPEDAARWTGEKVGEVEDIPEDVEQGFDRFGNRVEQGWDDTVEKVEDAPENVAEWAGRRVGDVEEVGDDIGRYGDRLDNAYDQGRDEERREDDGW